MICSSVPTPGAAPSPTAPGPDTCPRCGGAFHCGVNDDAACACSTLQLGPDTLAALRSRYSRCLCLACLQAIQQGALP